MNWRERITDAAERIRPLVRETPVDLSVLTIGTSTQLFLKLENVQYTGSFKFRGASNKISLLTPSQAAAGVVTASNGNHGLAVAAAAAAKGIDAEVFVSSAVSHSKLARIERYGASIHLHGDNPLDAELAARQEAERLDKVFISPYNDADVIAGQGTIGLEIHQELRQIDAVFVAVGGGGLIGGIGAYLKAVLPATEIIGCWPENSPVLWRCMEAGGVMYVPEQPTLSESTAGGLEPGSITLELCKSVVDRAVLVSESEIMAAMRRSLMEDHWVIEGAAGVALAAYLQEADRYRGRTVVVILCGRNVSSKVLNKL